MPPNSGLREIFSKVNVRESSSNKVGSHKIKCLRFSGSKSESHASNRMADCTKSILNDSSTKAEKTLVARVGEYCRRHGVGSEPVVVAISGGPDSVALTRALLDLQSTLRLQPLILAHLNHQLRGAESDADESFVEAMSRGLLEDGIGDVGFISQKEDVRRQALEAKDNLEKVARETRYAWLAHVARDAG